MKDLITDETFIASLKFDVFQVQAQFSFKVEYCRHFHFGGLIAAITNDRFPFPARSSS